MEIYDFVLFLILALVAEILGTMGGFGSSVFFVPMASLFFDFHTVLGITAIFHVGSNASKMYLFRKGIDKRIVVQFGIPAILFVIAGAVLSSYISTPLLEMALAVFLIAISIVLILLRNKSIPSSTNLLISGGSVSGFVAGLVGTGGAIRGLALSAFSVGKDSFIATSAIIDMGIDFSRSIVYIINGYVHLHDIYLIPFLIAVAYIGTWIGRYLLKFVSERQFKLLVLFLICLIGIYMLFRFIFY